MKKILAAVPDSSKMLALIKSFASSKGMDFCEYVDICIYPEMLESWMDIGMSSRAIKKKVEEQYFAYEQQRKYLSSLV